MSVEAVKRRKQASDQVTKFLSAIKRSGGTTASEINASLETLDSIFQGYLKAQSEVLSFTGAASLAFESEHTGPVTAAFEEAKDILLAALQSVNSEHSEINRNESPTFPIEVNVIVQDNNDTIMSDVEENVVSANKSNNVMEQRMLALQEQVMQLQQLLLTNQARQLDQPTTRPLLPRVSIPKFSGNIGEWTQFHDLFMSLIGNNARMSGAEKMHHLKNALTGEAERLLRTFAISDANYNEAWQVLTARYQDKRRIIAKHLDHLLDMPTITKQSHTSLRNLVDVANESIRSLRVLEEPVEHWDTIIVHILSKKLDTESRREWELQIAREDEEYATFNNLIDFIETLCRASEASSSSKFPSVAVKRTAAVQAHHVSTKSEQVCGLCNGAHVLRSCDSFRKLSIPNRREIVADKQLCYNCLSNKHVTSNCSSVFSCRLCKQKHHTMLHLDSTTSAILTTDSPSTTSLPSETVITTLCANSIRSNRQIMLATAVVHVQTPWGDQPLRLLIDPGSESSFITECVVQRLRLRKKKAQVSVTGLGGASSGTISGITEIIIAATDGKFAIPIEALVLSKITSDLPRSRIAVGDWPHLKDIVLADPTFDRPGPIDALLGADYYHLIISGGIRRGVSGTPIAQETKFGWILSGAVATKPISTTIVSLHVQLEQLLRQFWEVEEIGEQRHLTQEESKCEDHYRTTVTRSSSGRYTVKLPFREPSTTLGDSRTSAASRLFQMERRFRTNKTLHIDYCKFMDEYATLGHMTEVMDKVSDDQCYYLPHHAVIKDNSSTTKLRVVFDASQPSKSGTSLNDKLMVGPRLQEDLHTILLRFRKHRVALTADIAKMYRQIDVAAADRNFQRILWRKSSSDPVKEFQLNTVTYGTSAAPYLAVRTLQQLASDELEFPTASVTILNDFYVDDLITGCDSEDDAIELQATISTTLRRGGFDIRKWTSNSEKVLNIIPIDHQELRRDKEFSSDSVKTLGLHWKPSTDTIFFKFNPSNVTDLATKRTVLSEISRLFDPIGLLAPIIITGKIMLQQLWLRELGWDDPLPPELQRDWSQYSLSLQSINNMYIQRWLQTTTATTTSTQLHGFADASERAYAAAVYVRSVDIEGHVNVTLITAKTRVAPTKQLSIPRLELCAAHLLAKLMTAVKEALHFKDVQTFAWSDSTITLAWIMGHPSNWKTFVANRVSKIHNHIEAQHWQHVASGDNPADSASRGISPSDLTNFSLWWHGPSWLMQSEQKWPAQTSQLTTTLEEKAPVTSLVSTPLDHDELIKRYSSWSKLKRITALCLRFAANTKPNALIRTGSLTTQELDVAARIWIKKAQMDVYFLEITACVNNTPISPKSKIRSLLPIVLEDGLLRVGGRIHHSPLPFHQRHQLILPPTHIITGLILTEIHLINLHAGNQLMLAQLRRHYWIPTSRSVIRQFIHRCVTCFRHRAKPQLQLMGNLPPVRVTPCNAFQKSGVDYAGPITLRLAYARGPAKTYKAYICVFVCMTSRAVHLEAVSDMTSEAFIKAFTRFTSRRGPCTDLYSDNGTNFKGADKELKEMHQQLKAQLRIAKVAQSLVSTGTNWHFIPPAAPHFGGLWEAAVKSAKYHLRRVMGTSMLTFDDFQTLLCQIEACLNSRPLCPLSDDPDDFNYLTPAMLITGTDTHIIPEPDLNHLKINTLSRFQLIQKQKQDFWKAWRSEYLVKLQQRSKWPTTTENVSINQLVLMSDDNTPPAKWKLGRIEAVHPGSDGLVRVVTIYQGPQEAKRKLPIAKISVLPLSTDEALL